MDLFWPVVGAALFVLLLLAWLMDRSARRRGSRVRGSSDVWHEVRESRRDAEAVHPAGGDTSWTSWSRRNRR